ncbi:hypothetical protein FKM82_020349 [Ascaphus truei]
MQMPVPDFCAEALVFLMLPRCVLRPACCLPLLRPASWAEATHAPKLKQGTPDYLLPNSCLNNNDPAFSNPDPATYDYELCSPDQSARTKVGDYITPPQPRGLVSVCGEHNRNSTLGPTGLHRGGGW